MRTPWVGTGGVGVYGISEGALRMILTNNSGIYLVTLNNEVPISVNRQDPRRAATAITATKANCKIGRAKNLGQRLGNYQATFGPGNVNFHLIAYTTEIDVAEKVILAALDRYRIRGRTGRQNEWLENISSHEARDIAVSAIKTAKIAHTLVP